MREESVQGTLVRSEVFDASKRRDTVYCPACGGDRVYRVERRGIFQKRIYPLFGFFPWQCKECGAEVLLRKRNRRKRKHAAA